MTERTELSHRDADRRLSEVLSEFARTLVTDFPIQAILDHLVGRIVDVLPISGAGVTLISPGTGPRYVAASGDSALRFEQLQTELAEGPCVLTYETGEVVTVPDLWEETRFPVFATRALDEGLRAVFTFPLRDADGQLGALDLYRDTPGSLDDEAMAAAQTLADVAAAYLLNAQARVDLHASTAQALQSSLHDTLTGLPNRTLLLERLDHAIKRSQRTEKIAAILFADLDSFKAVNDTFGHHAGDELLVAVAERLTGLLRPGDTLARIAGDEFVILCENLDAEAQVEPLATRIGDALRSSFDLPSGTVLITASVGIAFAGRAADIPEDVLRDADTAMYQAKRGGGACHRTLDRGEERRDDLRASLHRDLRQALPHGELRLDYQPILATRTRRVVGVEALLRWAHPTHGILGPDTVIPMAEQSGLITDFGRWALEQACTDRQRWEDPDHLGEVGVAVNVSPHQLLVPGYASSVKDVLADTHTDPRLVTLEITESALVEDGDRAFAVLEELAGVGVTIALDDFGTGYSSLSYLNRLPVQVVKIDRGFVANLGVSADTRVIVGAIVGLAHGLRMTVVAEGIETLEQHHQVADLGCELCQGFLFARPMPAEAIDRLLSDSWTLPDPAVAAPH